MDSANSGSIQSSSGGDEEYDSRADSISALFHPTSSSSSAAAAAAAAAASLPPPPPSSSSSHHPNPSSFYESFSFLDPSPLLPLDSSSRWPPRPLRPSPTPTPDFPPLTSSLPRSPPIAQSSVQQPHDNSTAIAAPPRSSKKRSRASRRAPTTVLTTDTSNFRAMVQEFTGIPSPPFGAAASPFSRSRFDLFHSSSSSSSPSSLPHPYLLRPFAQKPPTFASPNPSSSSTTITAIIDALASTTNTISNAKASATIPITSAPTSMANSAPTSNNYQLPSPDPGLASQNQSLFNLQSQGPVINFQSLLAQKYTLPTAPPAFATRPQAVIPSAEFGSGELGLPPGLIRSEGVQSGWASASGPDGGQQARLRPVVGGNDNGAQQRVSSCKFNYSGPGSSELNGEKGSEGVAARGEGMVDSWICSSD